MKSSIFWLVFLISAYLVYAQDDTTNSDGDFSILRIEDGVKVIYNSSNSNFHFNIKCENFRQIEAENMLFLADDVLLQITPVPIEYIMSGKISNLSDSLALLYHFAFEVRNIRNNLSGNYKIDNEFVADSNRLIYFWSFDMPQQKEQKDMETVKMQMFATTRASERILMLSAVVVERNEPYDVRVKLVESLSSIVVSDEKIDSEAIREGLKQETDE